MVEALLWQSGNATLNLGTDIPMEQILAAVRRTGVETVALSFSACYPRGPIRANLAELADRLPQGGSVWIGGVRGIFPEELTPFRVAEVRDDDLTVDLNHPLAGRALTLEARILDIWAARAEHGGACQDIAELVTRNGPGIQARWRGWATDFWSDIPFARLDPSPDSNFYRKPRMVHHLDATALTQIAGLYRRLLPKGARILDPELQEPAYALVERLRAKLERADR